LLPGNRCTVAKTCGYVYDLRVVQVTPCQKLTVFITPKKKPQ